MKVSVITNRGVGIVRSAANRHEKCEIVDAVSSTHFENTASELATKSGEWWDGASGTITMVRAGNGSLKVSVSFPATSYAQPLKSIGIRVKAQGDERAHILYAVSDGNTAIALNRPYTCDYEIPINVSSDTIEDVGSAPVPGLEDYYTKSEIDADFENYYTKTEIDSKGYCTGEEVNSELANYCTRSEITQNYYSKKEIDGNYYKKTEIDSNYYTRYEIDSNYYTRSEINLDFYPKGEIDADFENYYTKTEIDSKGYCTEAEIDVNHYTKAEINNGYYPKSEIDGGYIANASYNNATNTLTLSSKDGSKQIDLDLS